MSSGQMIVDLNGLEAGSSSQEGELELVVADSAGADESQRLHVHCKLDVQGRRIHLHARLQGQARAHCHRCLSEFARDIATSFELILQRGGESPSDDVVALTESALEYDLTPIVREALILEAPIQLLCEPECKGLCSQCGRNRNVEPCSCAPAADLRWEALQKLSEKL